MAAQKPQNIEQYKKWLRDKHDVFITDRSRNYYESVSNKICKDFTSSTLWNTLVNGLERIDQQYLLETKYHLFITDFRPEMKIKPFDSFLEKTFRKNIIQNPNWPVQPEGGWILPDNWYTRINDIVRTLFVVKYLDGVNFFADKLSALLSDHNLPSTVDFEAKEEGYYAAHLYTQYECEIPGEGWIIEKISGTIEIQITTQLQEVIRRLLHRYYEASRSEAKEGECELKWQWDYKSDEFATNYLGHILHYVEGMIMDIREKQEEAI